MSKFGLLTRNKIDKTSKNNCTMLPEFSYVVIFRPVKHTTIQQTQPRLNQSVQGWRIIKIRNQKVKNKSIFSTGAVFLHLTFASTLNSTGLGCKWASTKRDATWRLYFYLCNPVDSGFSTRDSSRTDDELYSIFCF